MFYLHFSVHWVEIKMDEKALNSIDFVMQAIKYVTKDMHFE